MKPWEELADMEKREAIARRLGWESRAEGVWRKPFHVGDIGPTWYMEERLPHWPTDDGLAFTEVWPLIIEHDRNASLRLNESNARAVYTKREYFIGRAPAPWADAICHAAYILLRESNSADKS